MKFQIDNSKYGTLRNVSVFFDFGKPEDPTNATDSLTMAPNLVTITPEIGSTGGSLIEAVVPGLGSMDTLERFYVGTADICTSYKVVGYGRVHCNTTAGAITSAALQVKFNAVSYGCSIAC